MYYDIAAYSVFAIRQLGVANYGNPADERVILFSAISSSDNLRLGIRLGLGLGSVSVLIAGLTSTFRTPATCISQWQNNITDSSAGLPLITTPAA